MRPYRRTTDEERQLIIYHHAKGKTISELHEMLQIPMSTIGHVITRFNKNDQLELRAGEGRQPALTERNGEWLVRQIKKNPKTSAPALAGQLCEYFGIQVSAQKVRNALKQRGYNGRVARKKPWISKINSNKRLAFVKSHSNKDKDFWKSLIFTDESKFNLIGSDGRVMAWRQTQYGAREQEYNTNSETRRRISYGVGLFFCIRSFSFHRWHHESTCVHESSKSEFEGQCPKTGHRADIFILSR
jgi:transposase